MEVQAQRYQGDGEQRVSELLELSNAMVRIYKDLLGRGPTKAKTNYADENTLVSSLENTLTASERSMAELGELLRVEETRLFFQRACRHDFVGTVEEVTGRKVRAFVSGMDSENDVATEVFYLVPS